MLKAIAAALLLSALALPAMALTVCGERDKLLGQLARGNSEVPVAMGLATNGAVLEVLVAKSGSWTVIVTRPSGMSCVVATGEAWTDVPALVAGPGA